MAFNILYTKESLEDLEKIKIKSALDSKTVFTKIEAILRNNPFPYGKTIKKLKGIKPDLYRLRINAIQSYRIFYRIIGSEIYILKIVSKKDADKTLRNYFS